MINVGKLLIVLVALFLGACKLTVENSGGGVITSNDGKINCGKTCQSTYTASSSIKLEATPDLGYVFDGWGKDCSGLEECFLVVDPASAGKNVSAHFSAKPASIEIKLSKFDIQLSPNKHDNLTTTVNFSNNDFTNHTISVTQQIKALWGDVNGISILPVISDTFIASSNTNKVYSQDINAFERGLYQITTEAKILETGDVSRTVTMVSVRKSTPPVLTLSEPASNPGILPYDAVTSVLFSTKVRYSNKNPPIKIWLTGDVPLILNDDGLNGDLVAGDRSYSGTATIDTTGYEVGKCLTIIASAEQDALSATSDEMKICVSTFPAEVTGSDISDTNLLVDPQSGNKIISNELIIRVKSGLSEEEIYSIASSVNAEIVGAMSDMDIFQLRFSIPFTGMSMLEETIDLLENNPNVIEVGKHGIGHINVYDLDSAFTHFKSEAGNKNNIVA